MHYASQKEILNHIKHIADNYSIYPPYISTMLHYLKSLQIGLYKLNYGFNLYKVIIFQNHNIRCNSL